MLTPNQDIEEFPPYKYHGAPLEIFEVIECALLFYAEFVECYQLSSVGDPGSGLTFLYIQLHEDVGLSASQREPLWELDRQAIAMERLLTKDIHAALDGSGPLRVQSKPDGSGVKYLVEAYSAFHWMQYRYGQERAAHFAKMLGLDESECAQQDLSAAENYKTNLNGGGALETEAKVEARSINELAHLALAELVSMHLRRRKPGWIPGTSTVKGFSHTLYTGSNINAAALGRAASKHLQASADCKDPTRTERKYIAAVKELVEGRTDKGKNISNRELPGIFRLIYGLALTLTYETESEFDETKPGAWPPAYIVDALQPDSFLNSDEISRVLTEAKVKHRP